MDLGCLVSAKLVALWLLCEKNRFGLPHLASVARSLVGAFNQEKALIGAFSMIVKTLQSSILLG